MNLELNEKIIIVSGGAEPIGAEIVKVLVAENAVPVIVGRNKVDNLKALKSIYNKGFPVTSEFASAEDYGSAIQQVVEKFGRIDGLVNNTPLNESVGLENRDHADFVASLQKNLLHYYLMAHHAVPYLKKSKGAIVNVSSITAGSHDGNNSGSLWSNDGRNALTREWAVELLPYEIRVNAVIIAECFRRKNESSKRRGDNPEKKLKSIDEISSGKRNTMTAEIANVIAFLLSARSRHTTGQLIQLLDEYVDL